MEKNLSDVLNDVLSALNAADYNIFDANLGLEEHPVENLFYSPSVDVTDIDSFDCVSISTDISTAYFRSEAKIQQNWSNLSDDIKSGKVSFWDKLDEPILAQPQYDISAAVIQNNITNTKSLETVLAEFDSWAGTPVDILSTYGDFDMGHNVFEGDFQMDVPVSIYTLDDELIVKANFPWIKANSFENIYPSQLNLKSVLSILPVRVNSQEVKASFVNGEFKLEFPKEHKEELSKDKAL